MINSKQKIYSKAYVELYQIINNLSQNEQNKIPGYIKNNLLENMDKEYIFNFDSQKNILEQKYLTETKALFINLYKKYLSEDTEFWNKYDKICFNMIENEKREKCNPDSLFNDKKQKSHIQPLDNLEENVSVVEYTKMKWYKKIYLKFLNIFKK